MRIISFFLGYKSLGENTYIPYKKYNCYFWPKFQFVTKMVFFWVKVIILRKNCICDKKIIFEPKFRFYQYFYFLPIFLFLITISILTQISIFGKKNLYFNQNFGFTKMSIFLTVPFFTGWFSVIWTSSTICYSVPWSGLNAWWIISFLVEYF